MEIFTIRTRHLVICHGGGTAITECVQATGWKSGGKSMALFREMEKNRESLSAITRARRKVLGLAYN